MTKNEERRAIAAQLLAANVAKFGVNARHDVEQTLALSARLTNALDALEEEQARRHEAVREVLSIDANSASPSDARRQKHIRNCREYCEKQRTEFRAVGNSTGAGIMTNVLAWLILIGQGESP